MATSPPRPDDPEADERPLDETVPLGPGSASGGGPSPVGATARGPAPRAQDDAASRPDRDSGAAAPASGSRRLGSYRILAELGRGSQGSVYLAEDARIGRKVALKVLSAGLALSGASLRRFQREAEITSRLEHPGICSVFEAGEADGVPYIAMRLVEGETLARKIGRAREAAAARAARRLAPRTEPPDGAGTASAAAGPGVAGTPVVPFGPAGQDGPPSTRAEIASWIRFIEKAARAIHAAHEAGLIHRDIKPGNIMVDRNGDPVILDFGLAREEEGDAHSVTQSGDLLGTPAYMSPEQLLAHRVRLDRRTDIYSLGVTLYECLTLRLPHDGATRESLYQQILTAPPHDPRRLNPRISRDLKVVLLTALEKDRDRRYRTLLDFAEDLQRVLAFEPIRARPAGPLLRFGRWIQRNPVLAASTLGGFAFLALGLVVSLVLLREFRRQRDERDVALDKLGRTMAQLEAESRGRAAALRDKDAALEARTRALRRAEDLYLAALASSTVEEDPGRALLLGLEASQGGPDPLTDRVLLSALSAMRELCVLDHAGDPVAVAELSPGGDLVLTAAGSLGRIWDAGSGKLLRVLGGHEDAIRDAAFSPDGTLAATGSADGKAILFEAATGRAATILTGHRGAITDVEFSADGTLLLTASLDSTARIVSVPEGRLVTTLESGGEPIVGACFRPDGLAALTIADPFRRLLERAELRGLLDDGSATSRPVVSSADVWEIPTGKRLRAFAPGYRLRSGSFSPDGTRILLATAGSGPLVHALEWSPPVVPADRAVDARVSIFSPDGRFVLTAGVPGSPALGDPAPARHIAWLWDAATGETAVRLPGHTDAVESAAFRSDGSLVATASRDGTARIWELPSGRPIAALRGHAGPVASVRFHPDGRRVVTASEDGTARIWDAGPEVGAAETVLRSGGLGLSSNGRWILASGDAATCRILDAEGRQTATIRHGEGPRLVAPDTVAFATLTRDGQRILAHHAAGGLALWDVETGRWIEKLPAPLRRTAAPLGRLDLDLARVSPRLDLIACPSADGKELLGLDPETLDLRFAFAAGGDRIGALEISPDGSAVILALARDRSLRVVDAADGSEVARAAGPAQRPAVEALETSSDGKVVIAGWSLDGAIWIWRAGEPAPAPVRPSRPLAPASARLSPDGARILVVASDGGAGILSATTGEQLVELKAGGDRILRASFSPDGRRAWAILEGPSAAAWDSATGDPAWVLRGHLAPLLSLSASPAGDLIATTSEDGTARIWGSADGRLLRTLDPGAAALHGAMFSAGGDRLLAVSVDHRIHVWRVEDGRELCSVSVKVPRLISSIAFAVTPPPTLAAHPDRAITMSGGRCRVWELPGGTEVAAFPLAPASLPDFATRAALSPDGSRLLLYQGRLMASMLEPSTRILPGESIPRGGNVPVARVWDVDTRGFHGSLPAGGTILDRVAFSADGNRLLTVFTGGPCETWDTARCARLASVRSPGGGAMIAADLSRDGTRAVVVQEREAQLFDAGTGHGLDWISRGRMAPTARFSPAGDLLVVALADGNVLLLGPPGAEPRVLAGHGAPVRVAAFGEGGSLLATSARDGTIRVWDLERGAERLSLSEPGLVVDLAFVPGGGRLLALTDAGAVRAWPLDILDVARRRATRELAPDELDQLLVGSDPERRARRRAWEERRAAARVDELILAHGANPGSRAVRRQLGSSLLSLERALRDADPERRRNVTEAVEARIPEDLRGQPDLLACLAELQAAAGRVPDAVRSLEHGLRDPEASPRASRRLAALRAAVLPDLVSYASIDAALDAPERIVSEGDSWAWLPAHAAPPDGWRSPGFDDGSWARGATGLGYGDEDAATDLRDIAGRPSAICLRRTFRLDDPSDVRWASLSVRIDDGLVAWLNGVEVARVRVPAGPSVPSEAVAAAPEPLIPCELPVDPAAFRRGENVLAILALNHPADAADLLAAPELRVRRARVDARAVLSRLRGTAEGPDASARIAYLEGRARQLEGDLDAAAARFEGLVREDGSRPEPWLRLAQCRRAAGDPAGAAERLAQGMSRVTGSDEALWHLWLEIRLGDLGGTLESAAASVPRAAGGPGHTRARDLRTVLAALDAGRPFRIRCGAPGSDSDAATEGEGDRFHRGGLPGRAAERIEARGAADGGWRSFPRGSPLEPGYLIPLGRGAYRVTLSFADLEPARPGHRVFDVSLEGRRVLEAFDPGEAGSTAARRETFDVDVRDGTLDVAFTPRIGDPAICGIEVEGVDRR